MFNHLDYFNMSAIFENSVNEAAAQICRNRDNLHFDLVYDDKLSKLYLLSKGDRIDARFISANVRKTVEDHFLKAVEYMGRRCPGKLGELKKASVSVDVTENVRKYFEMTEPSIRGRGHRAVYRRDCPSAQRFPSGEGAERTGTDGGL